jgi:hypothetical protein
MEEISPDPFDQGDKYLLLWLMDAHRDQLPRAVYCARSQLRFRKAHLDMRPMAAAMKAALRGRCTYALAAASWTRVVQPRHGRLRKLAYQEGGDSRVDFAQRAQGPMASILRTRLAQVAHVPV